MVVLLGLLFMVGALGEAFAPATENVSKAVLVASGILGVVVAAAVLVGVAAGGQGQVMARSAVPVGTSRSRAGA